MLDILKVQAKKAAELVEKSDFVRIFTHFDADGISAGAIIAKSLLRIGKPFHLRFLKGLNEKVEYESDELVVLADMGSGYPDVVSEIDADVIIIDHHIPVKKIDPSREFVHINPHLAGLDGTYELSASGTAYIFANAIGNNVDLSSIAIIGVIGDKQKIVGGNAEIVKEGKANGFIEEKTGLNLCSGKVRDALKYSLEPFLDFYEKEGELEEFLRKIKIEGDKEIDELSLEEINILANAIVLRLLKIGAYEGVIDEFVGKKLILKNELISNAFMLTDVVNSCGRAAEMSIGLAICLRDKNYLEKGLEIWRRYRIDVLNEIQKWRDEVKDSFCMRYLVMEDALSTSPIATALSRYIYADKPLIVVNIKNGMAKVSARSNARLAEKIDLAEVMRLAAERVGGRGGGHKVAAGANIEPEVVEEFLKEVDRLCCMQG
ncbi:phosphoesterase [Archaeoglobales archaeon]|nr:MAG: phosphoesterase [Archaeoglobales archaeon]